MSSGRTICPRRNAGPFPSPGTMRVRSCANIRPTASSVGTMRRVYIEYLLFQLRGVTVMAGGVLTQT